MEIAVDRGDLIALVSETTEGMREDISLMKVGRITCQSFGVDVTPEMISRIEARLSKLETVAVDLGREASE